MPPMKIVPLLPVKLFIGSEIQQALETSQRVSPLGWFSFFNPHNSNCHIWSTIDRTNNPRISCTSPGNHTALTGIGNAEGLRVRQVGSVRSCLIPALYSSTNRVHYNREVESLRVLPAIGNFIFQQTTVIIVELWDSVEALRALGGKGALLEEFNVI